MQSTIYEHFALNYRKLEAKNTALDQKYKNCTKNQLKKALKQLKTQTTNQIEIKYVSKILRSRYKKIEQEDIDHRNCCTENFWKHCKNTFEPQGDAIKPDFSEDTCYKYIKKSLSKSSRRDCTIPSWLKLLDLPTNEFNPEKPTYREITNVIRKMKSSASLCPLDQMSAIAFRNCHYLRTQLWRFISKAWENALFPKTWRHGITILIHKKDSNKNPGNFRPITLLPILSKIFTSIIKNRIFTFVLQNKYIETNSQKGFWEKVSGCIEHTETLTYVINHARKKQRNLVITLLDLENTFGEVDHELITYVLKFHHVPDHIIQLIQSLYTDYRISIPADKYLTLSINVEKGVLQGDSLSPLHFNLVTNTLINTIKQEKLNCIGYIYDGCIPPKHWLHFADDTAIATALESDNQHLVNAFTKWSS